MKQKQQTTSAPVSNTIEVACERLGISRSGLYNLMATGQVRSIKLGGRRLIPERELLDLMDRMLDAELDAKERIQNPSPLV